MTAIMTDADNPMADYDATAAFLEKWKDAEEPSDQSEGAEDDNEETPEEVDPSEMTDEADEADETDEDEEVLEDPDADQDETPDTAEAKLADDDAQVVFSVDGKEHKVSVKELKRLAGQEAALTRKSQETAEERKFVEEEKGRYKTALETMQKRAEDKYRPYSEIDFLVASKQLEADEFEALRKEAMAAYDDYKFYTEELKTHKAASEQEENTKFLEEAKATIQVLSDPEKGIPNWSQDLYNEIRQFAVETNGMDIEKVNKITDPSLIKMMWQAMRYARAKKVSTKKIAAAPKKVVKASAPAGPKAINKQDSKALNKLRETGNRDAAVDALMARWQDDE